MPLPASLSYANSMAVTECISVRVSDKASTQRQLLGVGEPTTNSGRAVGEGGYTLQCGGVGVRVMFVVRVLRMARVTIGLQLRSG